MRNHSEKKSHKSVTVAFASGLVLLTGWSLAATPAAPGQAAQTPGATATPAAPVRSAPSVQTTHNSNTNTQQQTTGNRERDHDHDGDHRRQNVYLPWWGYAGVPDGWNGWNGFDNNQNNAQAPNTSNNSSTVPNDAGTYPTTMPSQPSAAGAAAQATNAMEKSPEMIAANNRVQDAQADYDKQRERVLAQLRDKPEYVQALQRRSQGEADLKAAKAAVTTQPAVTDAATAKMDAASDVTRLEEQAITADPDAAAAKTHLAEAVANRDTLRARLLAGH